MNFLSIFVLIPLLMLLGLWLSRNIAQIRTVMVVGSSALLIAAVALTVGYLQARAGGDTAEMLFRYGMVCPASYSLFRRRGRHFRSYVATLGCHRIHRNIRFLATTTAY